MSEVPGADLSIDVVAFRVAGHLFGIEAGKVRGSQPVGSCPEGVPGATTLFGFSSLAPAAAGHVLTIKGGAQDRLLFIEAPPELMSLSAAAIHPLPELVAARGRLPQLRAIALVGAESMALMDFGTTA